ncbi:hypothetical protein BC832DRAFT_591904 [Gaertneriomyces semiglobifer]|nr:hypothetical protein BC832DRAFT_591904 [Gaertneriomyces semiglobifer]
MEADTRPSTSSTTSSAHSSLQIDSLHSSTSSISSSTERVASGGILIQPWRYVKKAIRKLIARFPSNSSPLPITLTNGFLLSSLLRHQSILKLAIYLEGLSVDRVVTVDDACVNLWRAGNNVKQLPHGREAGKDSKSVRDVMRWCWIGKWKALAIATGRLELKLLDVNLEEMSSVSSVKPVLSLEFNEYDDELIAGGVGNIRLWTFKKHIEGHRVVNYFSGPRLIIDDLNDDQWVSHIVYHHASKRIYAAVDASVHVYDSITGARLETLDEIHELSISAMIYYEPFGYLITASRDSTIKIHSRQHYHLQTLNEHTQPVTGLCAIPPPSVSLANARFLTPFFLSCSLDGTIRMWNAEVGTCIHSHDTGIPCLGLQWMKSETFMHWAKDTVYTWALNRFYSTFSYIRSDVQVLRRSSHPTRAARILVVSSDGSVRLLSPVTGALLTVGFPAKGEVSVVGSAYDLERVWVITANNEVIVYDTNTNPAQLVGLWEVKSKEKAQLTCSTPLTSPMVPAYEGGVRPTVFGLLSGTNIGQVVMIDVRGGNKWSVVVQAHIGAVTDIFYEANMLFTCGSDGSLKVWSIHVPKGSPLRVLNELSDESLSDWHRNGDPLSLRLRCTATIVIDDIAHRLCWNPITSTLCFASSANRCGVVTLSADGTFGAQKFHSKEDDHAADVTALISLDVLRIYASSSSDGSVKIWDASENNLIKEMHFASPISCIAFLNLRGDMLVSLADQIVLVRVEDYLPTAYLRKLINSRDFEDDEIEEPGPFDTNLDFWRIYQEGEETWHVNEVVTDVPNEGRLLEEFEATMRERAAKREQLEDAENSEQEAARNLELTVYGDRSNFLGVQEFIHDVFLPSIASRRASRIAPPPLGLALLEEIEPLEEESLSDDVNAPDSRSEKHDDVAHLFASEAFLKTQRAAAEARADRRKARGSVSGRRASLFGTRRPSIGKSEDPTAEPWTDKARAPTRASRSLVGTPNTGYGMGTNVPEFAAAYPKGRTVPRTSATRRKSLWDSPSRPRTGVENQEDRGQVWEAGFQPPTGYIPTFPEGMNIVLDEDRLAKLLRRPRTREQRLTKPKPRRTSVSLSSKMTANGKQASGSSAAPSTQVARPAEKQVVVGTESGKSETTTVQARIRQGLERVGILPNSVVASTVELAKEKDREAERAERREKDKVMISKARAIVARRQMERAKQEGTRGVDEGHSGIVPPWKSTASMRFDGSKVDLLEESVDFPTESDENDNAGADAYEVRKSSPHTQQQLGSPMQVQRSPPEIAYSAVATLQLADISEEAVAYGALVVVEPNSAGLADGILLDVHPVDLNVIGGLLASTSTKQEGVQEPKRAPLPRSEPQARQRRESKVAIQDLRPPVNDKRAYRARVSSSVDKLRRMSRQIPTPKPTAEEEEEISPLEVVTGKFWFPGLQEGKALTAGNVSEVLLTMIKTGYWSEKCEASDALLFLYKAMPEEFTKDPVQTLLLPQLEQLTDSEWQVRARICENLTKYGIHDTHVLQSLIGRLGDPEEVVRRAAIASLDAFGVNSKQTLRNVMVQMNMLAPPARKPHVDWLDILLARLRAQQEAAISRQCMLVGKWTGTVGAVPTTDRPPSSMMTLVRPPTRPARSADSPLTVRLIETRLPSRQTRPNRVPHLSSEHRRRFSMLPTLEPTGVTR